MDNRAVVERIMKNLAFDLETVPKTRTGGNNATSSSKTDPLNLKIRVRKKEISNEPHNQGFISNNQSEPEMVLQKVRLVNSDETIMSFDMFMEAEFDKKTTRKPRKHIFDKLKPGLCLGAADDDEHPYMPNSGEEIESNPPSKPNEVLKQPFQLAKNTHENFGDSISNRRERHFLGRKCKPGGCLDPPFDEDRYAYKPSTKESLKHESKEIETSKAIKETAINVKSDIKTPDNKKRKSKDLSMKSVDVKVKESILSLYKAESPKNSVITYPPDDITDIPKTKISIEGNQNKGSRKRLTSEDKSKQSVNESINSFFSLPKGVIRDSNISVARDQPKRQTYSPKSIRNKPVEYVKAPVSISVSLDSVPLEQNDIETVDRSQLEHDRSPTNMRSDSKYDELESTAPFILPAPISVPFTFKSNNSDAQISSSKTENIDSEITTTKKASTVSIHPSTYTSYDATPKLGSRNNYKEIDIIEDSFIIPLEEGVKSKKIEESPAIDKKIINKNGISKLNTTIDRKERLLEPAAETAAQRSNSAENKTYKTDHSLTIQQPRKESVGHKKASNEKLLNVRSTAAPTVALANPALASAATIKHADSQAIKLTDDKYEENVNKNAEHELSVQINCNQKENLMKHTALNIAQNTKNTTLDDNKKTVPANIDKITKSLNTVHKSPIQEIKKSSINEMATLLDKENKNQNSSNILNKNLHIKDQLIDRDYEKPFKENSTLDQQINVIKDFEDADNLPSNLTDIKSVEKSCEDETREFKNPKVITSKTLIENDENASINTNEKNTKNKRTISPDRNYMLEKRKTSQNKSFIKDKTEISPESASSDNVRASPDRQVLDIKKSTDRYSFDKKRISQDKEIFDKNTTSLDKDTLDESRISPNKTPFLGKINNSPGYLDKRRTSPDKESLNKRSTSPDNGSLHKRRISQNNDYLGKKRISLDKDSLEERRTSPENDYLDKRTISPGEVSLEEKQTSPENDYLDKRRISPDKVSLEERRTSPENDYLNKRRILLDKDSLEERRTSPENDYLNKRRISLDKDFLEERQTSAENDYLDKRRISPDKVSLEERRTSPENDYLNKRRISLDKAFLEERRTSPEKDYLNKRGTSPDKNSLDKRRISPDKVSLEERRTSPENDYLDKRRIYPDKVSLEERRISTEKNILDKRRISLDKDFLEERPTSPEKDYLNKRRTSPDKDYIDKRNFSPDKDYLDKRNTSPNKDYLDKRSTSPDKDSLDKRRISPNKDSFNKRRISPDINFLDKKRTSLEKESLDERKTSLDIIRTPLEKDSLKLNRTLSPDKIKTMRSISPDSVSSDKKRYTHTGSIDNNKNSLNLDKKPALPNRGTLDKRKISPDRIPSKNSGKHSPDRGTTKDNRKSPDRIHTPLIVTPKLKIKQKPCKTLEGKLLTSPNIFSANDSSMVSIDLAFHSYVNNRNERILSTVDVRNHFTRYPNDSIILIKSQVKLDSIDNNEFNIPIDSELDMAIEIKKTDDNSKIFYKKEAKSIAESINVKVPEINFSNTHRTTDVIQKGHPMTEHKRDNNKMCNTLTDIYEHELVPLQSMIRDLKQEIDALTALQISFKKKVTCQKNNKPRIILNKRCSM